jgi:signal transduction histidine kinase
LLILLPAILLAGAGFYALRRDRLLVEHEAFEQARSLATGLASRDLPPALMVRPPDRPLARFTAPQDDLIMSLAAAPDYEVVGFLVDAQLRLVWPPPIMDQPAPRSMEFDLPDKSRLEAWNSLQKLIWRSQDVAGMPSVESALRRVVELDLPEDFLALARYQAAVRLLQQGSWKQARDLFELVRGRHPDIVGDQGLSWKMLAEWQLLRSFEYFPEKAPFNPDWLDGFMTGIIRHPSPVTQQLLLQVQESMDRMQYPDAALRTQWQGRMQSWQQVARAHARSRALHQALLTPGSLRGNQAAFSSTNFWFTWQDDAWFITRHLEGNQMWFLARTARTLGQRARLVLEKRAPPAYFSVEVAAADRVIVPGRMAPGEQAKDTGRLVDTVSHAGISVQVSLADAAGLYARQRWRTLWFGGLILMSLSSVMIGVWTMKRAFREQQQLNQLKTNFVSSVSHELRTPIASVRMMAEELSDITTPDEIKSRQYHGFMVQECRRLTGLIENVLDFTRLEQGRKTFEFEPLDMSKLLQRTVDTWARYTAGKPVRFSTVLPDEPVEIEADGPALQQVLANLLDNAIKYSPKEGEIVTGLEAWWNDAKTVRGARFWVQDQGPGIPQEEQARIFDRFYRCGSELRRETQGVGLGLAIARGIVEAHRGRITVVSSASSGSRFIVELPSRQNPGQENPLS